MPALRSFSVAALSASALLATSIGFVGCSSVISPIVTSAQNLVSGNWQVSSVAPVASKLPALSGEISGSASAVTGIFHANSAATCVSPNSAIGLSGHADANGVITLTGTVSGGTLSVQGTPAEDGKSLTGASYKVTGGSCAFTAQAPATAQSYSSVTGTYTGTFSDAGGQVISLTADLTQTPSSDTDGNFQLSGTGNLGSNPCFSSPVSVSNSQVTGGTFTLTYADPNTMNSVTATGSFSPDASTLTVSSWTLTGSCGPDSGTGLLTRQ